MANQRFLGANPYNVPPFSGAFMDSASFETFHESMYRAKSLAHFARL